MYSSVANLMSYICTLQYGTLIFKQAYVDDKASKDYISNRLSLAFLSS